MLKLPPRPSLQVLKTTPRPEPKLSLQELILPPQETEAAPEPLAATASVEAEVFPEAL